MTTLRAAIGFFGVVTALLAQEPHAVAGSSPPRTLALLVGIADYPPESQFPPLRGPANDLDRAVATLTERFGFEPQNIVTLRDRDATHANIVRAIDTHLIRRAGPDTHVVLWFSGHGSRVPDASGKDSSASDSDEVSDETFVAWDSRIDGRTGSYDISDDELFSLLSAVKSKNVVMVADCCHSSGLLRGGPAPGVRETAPGVESPDRTLLAPFWPKDVAWRDDDTWRDGLQDLVLVSACGSRQEAGEIEMGGRTYGTLTWFLTQVLSTADERASWASVAAEVRALTVGVGSRYQFVEAAGAVDRAIFGGSGIDVPRGYYQVDWLDQQKSTQLLVGAGRLQGLGVGAELEVFDVNGKKIGSARVDTVRATACNATWTAPGKPPVVAMRAYPKSLGASAHRLRVFVDGSVDRALVDSPVVEIVADRAAAEYVLREVGGEIVLGKVDGPRVRRTKATVDAVRLGLLKEHQFRFLWEAAAAPGVFPIEVRVVAATPEEIAGMKIVRPPAVLHDVVSGPGYAAATIVTSRFEGRDRGGAYVKLVVKNCAKERLHVALVAASEDGEVNVLGTKTADNMVAPGAAIEKLVWVGVGETWGAEWMKDRYLIVATQNYADFRPFTSEAAEVLRGGGDPVLPPFLREAFGGSRTRGDLDAPNWGVAVCELHLTTAAQFAKSQRPAAKPPADARATK